MSKISLLLIGLKSTEKKFATVDKPFVDIALTFFDSSFNSFLFDVAAFSLLLKSFLRN